jgi:tetratricopeptide (TPR) repeat protein
MSVLERLLERENPEQLLCAIEQAQKMGLVGFRTKDPEAPFEFAHELIRQTLVATIAQPRRQRLHLNAAAAIEIAHAHEGGARAAEIAHHLIQAGPLSDPQRVKRYLVLAGRNALQAAAYEEARRHLSAAVAYHERGSRDYAELLLDLATAERGLGDWNQALAHWREAVDLFTAMGDCEATGNIFFEMFEGLLWSGRGNEAAETAQRGLEGLREECGSRVHLLASSGLINSLGGKYEPARKAFADALSLSGQLDDQKLASRVLAYRAVSDFYFLKLNEALDDGRRSASAGETAGAPWSRAIGLSRVQTALHHLGRNEEAAAVARELEPLARKLGHFAALSFSIWTRAWAEFGKQPDFARLQKQLAEDLEINRTARIPLLLAPALAQFSVLELLRGNQRAALDYAAEARALSPFHVMLGFGAGALFRQMAYAGDRIGALALLEESRGKLPRSDATNTIGSYAMLLAVVEGLYILGEHTKAAEFYPLTLQLIDTGVICFVWMARFPQTVAAIAAAAARNWTAAERHFDIALRQAQAFPHQLEIAELQRLRAAMLIDRGAADDAQQARTLLTEALDVYGRIGMPRHVELAHAMLAGMQTGRGAKASRNH